jgi:hypothetical protein
MLKILPLQTSCMKCADTPVISITDGILLTLI